MQVAQVASDVLRMLVSAAPDTSTTQAFIRNSGASASTNGVPFPLFWITLALVNGVLAQSRRRSGFAWFVSSLFLGPVATFSIGFLDPGKHGK